MASRRKPRNLHDRAFKALLSPPEAAWPILRAALPPALAEAIDPGSLQPGPTDFVNDELEEDHRDLLFTATIRGRPVLFYVLEHQSTVLWFMSLRLLRYVLKVWDWWLARNPEAKSLPAVIPVVLHQGAKPWDAPRSLTELIDLPPELRAVVGRYVPALDFALEDLGAVEPVDLTRFPGPPLVRITLSFMRAIADPREDPLVALDGLGDAIRSLLGEAGGRERLRVVLRYTVLARRGLDVRKVADALERVAGEEAADVLEPLVEAGMRELLEMQLRVKFRRLSPEIRERIREATSHQLQAWGKRILTAVRIEDVFASRGPRARRSRKK